MSDDEKLVPMPVFVGWTKCTHCETYYDTKVYTTCPQCPTTRVADFPNVDKEHTCVCGHTGGLENSSHNNSGRGSGQGRCKLNYGPRLERACNCVRFRSQADFPYWCGYHFRHERLPCAKD